MVGLFEQTQTAMQARAARSVDIALVVRNWLFGWYIVEFENGGAERTELYGQKLLKKLSEKLKQTGIKGMSLTNLKQFRLFYETYKEIGQAVPDQSFYNEINGDKIAQTVSAQSLKSQKMQQTRHVKTDDENPTVGILLCLEKNDELVELTLPENANIYVSEYQLYLPSKEELKKQLEEAQREWALNHG